MAVVGPLTQEFINSVALDPPEDGLVRVSDVQWLRMQQENLCVVNWTTILGYEIRIVPIDKTMRKM